jgi:pimeloyl-ACP methyl ester carboxylesterase
VGGAARADGGVRRAPGGVRIAYETWGDGPPLMLLHGGGQSRQAWIEAGYVARLQGRFR